MALPRLSIALLLLHLLLLRLLLLHLLLLRLLQIYSMLEVISLGVAVHLGVRYYRRRNGQLADGKDLAQA